MVDGGEVRANRTKIGQDAVVGAAAVIVPAAGVVEQSEIVPLDQDREPGATSIAVTAKVPAGGGPGGGGGANAEAALRNNAANAANRARLFMTSLPFREAAPGSGERRAELNPNWREGGLHAANPDPKRTDARFPESPCVTFIQIG